MELIGRYHIKAPRQLVWRSMNDPEVLKLCIPGCETIIPDGENQFRATVTTKIGPVKAKFKGKVTLSDLDPPSSYKITGEGQGGPAGFAKGGAIVKLTDDGGDTILKYQVDATVGGKLAQIGQRFIDGAAKKLADEFFAALNQYISEPEPMIEVAQDLDGGLAPKIWVSGLIIATLVLYGLIVII